MVSGSIQNMETRNSEQFNFVFYTAVMFYLYCIVRYILLHLFVPTFGLYGCFINYKFTSFFRTSRYVVLIEDFRSEARISFVRLTVLCQA